MLIGKKKTFKQLKDKKGSLNMERGKRWMVKRLGHDGKTMCKKKRIIGQRVLPMTP
jgi:hypothetical protein